MQLARIAALTVLIGLSACSSESTPTNIKLSQNIHSVEAFSVLKVISQRTLQLPHAAQSILSLENFTALDNVYDQEDHSLLIPRGAVISALYANDGARCSLTWKAVYANNDEFHKKRGTLSLEDVTAETICNPLHGIKRGTIVGITFKSEEPE